MTERLVLDLANKIDPELAGWIKDNVPFPSTMVDRITPVRFSRSQRLIQFSLKNNYYSNITSCACIATSFYETWGPATLGFLETVRAWS